MKKILTRKLLGNDFPNISLKMKLTTLLVIVSFFQIQANTYSQNTKVTLNLENVTIENVLKKIESQSEFIFFYENSIVNLDKKVSISVNKKRISHVLKHLFSKSYISYEVLNKHIMLKLHSEKTKTPLLNNVVIQQSEIKGTVTDQSNVPLPGVNIIIQNTSTGTQTDFDGNYTLEASKGDVLIFSFLGMKTQTIEVGDNTILNVTMLEDAANLNEVVVTALGIKREKKAITYSAQNVGVDEVSEARSLNVANSLSGKVAGLNFSTASNGVGSSSRVTLRGNRSLTGNNQPLYVIDGIPIDNSASTPNSDTGGFTGSDGISNINPEDIESISVLKGPSAAALYGTRASNGVIIINTKSGKGAFGTKISVSSNITFSSAYNLLDLQNEYGQGSLGAYQATSRNSWGAKLNGQSVTAWQPLHNPDYAGPATYTYVAQPNNVIDFFDTGYNLANSISVTVGKEQIQGYFSYTNTTAEGIVGGNRLDRHNLNLRLTSNLTDKLTLDAKANFILQDLNNPLKTGETSTGEAAYTLPRSLPFSQYKDFEYIDAAGQLQYNFVSRDDLGAVGGNPFWFSNRHNRRDEKRNRFIGFTSLKYQFAESLSLQVRSGIDQYTNNTISKSYGARAFGNDDGSYGESKREVQEINTDFLLAYNKTFENFSLGLNFGGNALSQKSSSVGVNDRLSRRNFFSISNLQIGRASSSISERKINSLYGFAQIGYKSALFLDVTTRNDWSSTLPSNNRSFFYPSIGISSILSEMIPNLKSDKLTYFKVRASYAQVGNDTAPYRLSPTYIYNGANGGIITRNTLKPNENLKPEISSSIEFGTDIRLFKNRLGLDFTWFKTNTTDQIFTIDIPESSGFSQKVINGGEVENKGIEFVLSAKPIKLKDFSWDITANFASYKSKVISINGDRETLSIGGEGRIARVQVTKGGEYGDFYIRGFNRTDNGDILVASNGVPEFTSGLDIKGGNFNPDWTAGLQNRFAYKNFSLSFLLDFRIGGEVLSYTQARLAGIGASKLTLANRDGFVVDGVVATRDNDGNITSTTPNTTNVTAETYWTNVAPRNARSAEDFVYDATNIRLRELVFGYSLPSKTLKNLPFSNASISLVGRNLFFLLNKAEFFDPEQGVGIGNIQGIESFNLPTTRDFGVNIKLEF
ncbi:SusC/RagA family TonB-linked outer membrane protein [Flavivirga spongiicola]|uniref:SusC/RagA family TonB-linked outer membrane protein n=1 Tax=Flavivirga spongiicola TaxID=421621 RepID=A0ABU7XXI3_9FLAO|nr:SusC/RagA family TonB-linked outer membrane protein [Flavivirga sp. MEBiC05379]MDO5979579.1 SusC/RagA family TonB-linked outer membrane protein [Flavivirga sp. MEBiC05379]